MNAEAGSPTGRNSLQGKPEPGVQAVRRVFELLELIENAGGVATLSALSSAANLPSPTIHRHLRTLASLGCVRQLSDRRYALGPRLIAFAEKAYRQLGALELPQLKAVVHELGETSEIAVLDADMVTYIAQVPSIHSMRIHTKVGRREHVCESVAGQAILAQLDDDAIRQLIAYVGVLPGTTGGSGTEDLWVELRRIRNQGYAAGLHELDVDVQCVAVGVPNAPVPLVISVSGPTSRMGPSFIDRAVPVLQQAALACSRDIQD